MAQIYNGVSYFNTMSQYNFERQDFWFADKQQTSIQFLLHNLGETEVAQRTEKITNKFIPD